MTPYADPHGPSGVAAYTLGAAHIDVRFKSGAIYRYTVLSVGQANFDHMARLARAGEGLSTFISRVVRDPYAARVA